MNVSLCLHAESWGAREGWATLWLAPQLCILPGLRSTHSLEDGHFKFNIEVDSGHNLVRKMGVYQAIIDIDTNSLVSGSNGNQKP